MLAYPWVSLIIYIGRLPATEKERSGFEVRLIAS